jgi:ferredoxin
MLPPTLAAMKVVIDTEQCTGHGRCYTLAPEVFDGDDDGYGLVRVADVPPELEEKARLGVRNCPEGAIRIEP